MDVMLRIMTGVVIEKMKDEPELSMKLGIKDVSTFDGVLVKDIEKDDCCSEQCIDSSRNY